MANRKSGVLWQTVRRLGTAVGTPVKFAAKTGHFKSSLRSKAIDSRGEPLPWYTFPMIEFLKQRDVSDMRVLEFGGGQSTLWWAAHAASVLCIEEDASWCQAIRAQMPANVDLRHVDKADFDQIEKLLSDAGGTFDLVIVDGHLRREATALAKGFLSEQAAVILDNAEGYGFQEETSDWPMTRVDFYGFAPGVIRQHCTSLLCTPGHPFLSPGNPIAVID